MELFYIAPESFSGDSAEFDEFEARHIIKTLRKKDGDSVQFTDGNGNLYTGILQSAKKSLHVKVEDKQFFPSTGTHFALAIGFIRTARLDILIEKGTELGVNQFFLFASEHTNYYTSNIKHWEKISRQAIKQSNRLHLPVISTIQKFDSLVAQSSGFHHRFVTDQSGSTPLSGLLNSETISQGSVLAVIGPEGGLSPAEIDLCRQNDFHLVSMGNSRLRAETAALTFAAYVNLIR